MINRKDILLVESETDSELIVRSALRDLAKVHVVSTAAAALEAIEHHLFPIVLLEVNLSDGNGFDLCAKIRNLPNGRPSIVSFLTRSGSLDERMRGFYAGADDYILKPFETPEFQARISAKFQSFRRMHNIEMPIIKGPFSAYLTAQRITVRDLNQMEVPFELTTNQFKILLYLIRNDERPISREELLQQIWGQDVHISGRTIDTHMHAIRQALGDFAKCIQSIHGKGYCFTVKHMYGEMTVNSRLGLT